MGTPYVVMKNIDKRFPGVHVLKDVTFQLEKGEIHALLGENGAGKSTLMKVLGGVHIPDKGTIYFDGKEIKSMDSQTAKKLGIAFVHQELNLSESVSVAENIYLGRLPTNKLGIVNYKKLYEDTQSVLEKLGAKFTPETIVSSLTTANKQLVEIAKAVSTDARIIIFDEPTTSLSDKDVENLFIIIKMLKEKGVSSVYISHRMKEIFELCDIATILRDGEYVGTIRIADTNVDGIIQMMVGREITNLFPKEHVEIGETILEVNNLSSKDGFIKPASFYLRKGEILGFSGLVGAGRTELMRLLFGADSALNGEIKINGTAVSLKTPHEAIKNRICLLTEDRKQQGLFLNLSIVENVNFTNLKKAILDKEEMKGIASDLGKKLRLKSNNLENSASSLSGGNQQKVVLAKWLNTKSQIFIFDEPTKGIDVGAKAEIYSLMSELVKQGMSIIMISSEMPELLGLSDRVYIMCEGRIAGELTSNEFSAEQIMKYATSGGN